MAVFDVREEARKETKMEMTPMIDVTFLLLIFFLCTIKFKILEGKIPAYLPKDVGVNATPIDEQLEKIDIYLYRDETVQRYDARGYSTKWVWQEDQIRIEIQGTKMSGLNQFFQTIKRVHEKNPEAKATFYPGTGTLYIDTVKVINECLRADFTAITFAGAPKEAGGA